MPDSFEPLNPGTDFEIPEEHQDEIDYLETLLDNGAIPHPDAHSIQLRLEELRGW